MTSSTLTRKAFLIGVSSFGAGLRPLDRAVDHARDFGELLHCRECFISTPSRCSIPRARRWTLP